MGPAGSGPIAPRSGHVRVTKSPALALKQEWGADKKQTCCLRRTLGRKTASAGTCKRKAGVGAIPLPAPGTSSGVLDASRVAPMGAHSLRGHEGRASRALQKHPQPGTRSLAGTKSHPRDGKCPEPCREPPEPFPMGPDCAAGAKSEPKPPSCPLLPFGSVLLTARRAAGDR